MKQKKAAMELNQAPALALTLGLLVLISAAIGLSVSSMRNTLCTYGADSTGNCLNSTGGSGGELGRTAAYNISTSGLTGITNFTGQTPTIGTVLGVALIIGIVVAAFAFKKQENSF